MDYQAVTGAILRCIDKNPLDHGAYRDGWSSAEARAKDSELVFKRSEKEFLKLVLRICRDLGELELKLSNVEIRFTRRNYENITEKANVLTTMIALPPFSFIS